MLMHYVHQIKLKVLSLKSTSSISGGNNLNKCRNISGQMEFRIVISEFNRSAVDIKDCIGGIILS